MKPIYAVKPLTLGLTLLFSNLVFSNDDFDGRLLDIQHKWAKVNYTLIDKHQKSGFEQLISETKSLIAHNPDRAEPLVWLGIIQSSYADAKGGIGALTLAKDAKKSLERSLRLDDQVLGGSAYISLGTLYYKVPGWPIGFGDDDDANKCLQKALSLNPQGIDSNYFYAEYLYHEKQYDKAQKYLLIALSAPNREDRPLADEFRRNEIHQLLLKVDKKLSKSH